MFAIAFLAQNLVMSSSPPICLPSSNSCPSSRTICRAHLELSNSHPVTVCHCKDKAWLYQFWKPDTLKYSFHVTLGFNCIFSIFLLRRARFQIRKTFFITLVNWSPYNFSWAAGFDTIVNQYHHYWPMQQRHFHLLYVSAATEYLLLTCLATEKATTKNLLIWNGSLRTY